MIRRFLPFLVSLVCGSAHAATITITVQEADPHFDPKEVTIQVGDTVEWIWNDNKQHAVVSGNGNTGQPDGVFNSGVHRAPFTYSFTFQDAGKFPYYCGVHRTLNIGGTWPEIDVVAPSPTPGPQLANISTRGIVQTGDNVMIGGVSISGTVQKRVIFRALGPTLAQPPFKVPGTLPDPVLELYNSNNVLIASNDNWRSSVNVNEISASGYAPPDDAESAILLRLDPGNYTAIVRGASNATGVALVETYDLDLSGASKFGNISTRGFVQSGDNVMIGGVSISGSGQQQLLFRALGPTLGQPPFNVPNTLADPFLDVRNSNGTSIVTNDNWKDTQQVAIQATGLAPPNDLESAILIDLPAGSYTAILSGVNNGVGNAIVEAYGTN